MRERTTALLLIAVVALGAMSGVAAAEGDLAVAVEGDDGDQPVVTVTENGTAVENTTVDVSLVDENASYTGAGEYQTDGNGTVTLPAPEEDVTVNVTATAGNETVTATEVELEAPDGLEVEADDTDDEPVVTVTDNDTAVENASVNVTTLESENGTYVGDGSYETDANGTVRLPAPEQNVTVDVTATYENETVSTEVGLTVGGEEEAEAKPFGQLVREFIESINDREGGIGAAVSEFVTQNNPGNAPDHAGGPGGPNDADDGDAANESDAPGNGNAPDHAGNGNGGEQGPPDHAGQGNDGKQGPPDHAGDGSDDANDETEEDGEDEENDADEEDREEDEEDEDDDERDGNPGNGNGPP